MVVIITGASSGIGLVTARFLAQKGLKVYGLSRRKVQNENFESLVCDITDEKQLKENFEYVFAKEGKIDVLVNNAGMGIAGAVEYTTQEELKKIIDLNVIALMNSSKNIVRFMRESGGGKIINIGSVAGVIPIPFQTAYSVTKAAVDMFSMSFGLEVKDFNISTTCLLPGDTKTGFTASREKSTVLENTEYQQRIKRSIEKMEKDEQNGKDPISVSKVVYKVIKKKKAPSRITIGDGYKLIVFLSKILPRKFMLFIVKKMYG